MITETNLTPAAPIESRDESIRQHYQSVSVAVKIPALQAVITGLTMGLSAATVAWLLEASRWYAWGVSVASLTLSASWLLLLYRWHDLVNQIELALGIDLNHDGRVGDIEPPPPIRIEVKEDHRLSMIDLPGNQEQLLALASGLVAGLPFSESQWTGNGAPFTKRQFHELRAVMIKRNLICWNNPNAKAQGITLTRSGSAVIRHLASMAASPIPALNAHNLD